MPTEPIIAVVGSRGFIGRHVVVELARRGHRVLALTRGSDPVVFQRGVFGHQYLPTRPETLLPTELFGSPMVLVALGWDLRRGSSFLPSCDSLASLAAVLDYWSGRGLQKLIAFGSAEEFGQRGGTLQDDDLPEGRLSAYGWGKFACRSMVENWSAGTEIPSIWLRPFTVYGPGQTGSMAVPYALRQAFAGQPGNFSDGTQRRDFVDVRDVARAVRLAVEVSHPGFTPINLGTGTAVPVRGVLELLRDSVGTPAPFHFGAIPRREGEPLEQVAAVERAERILGWRAEVDWQNGIRHLVRTERGSMRWTA